MVHFGQKGCSEEWGGVAKRASATRKVEIPDGARKEARYFFIMKL